MGPIAVPPHLVEGRGYVEVNRLFLALHDAGYRVVSREMNEVDEKCAEFVLVNVNEENSWERSVRQEESGVCTECRAFGGLAAACTNRPCTVQRRGYRTARWSFCLRLKSQGR